MNNDTEHRYWIYTYIYWMYTYIYWYRCILMPAALDYNFCLCFSVLPCRVPCKYTEDIQIKIQYDSSEFCSSFSMLSPFPLPPWSSNSRLLSILKFGLCLNSVRPPSFAWHSLPMTSLRNYLQVESSGSLNSPCFCSCRFCFTWCPKTELCHFVYFI